MRFQYIGPDDEAPKETVFLGYAFTLRGPAVDITDDETLREIRDNQCFRMMDVETAHDDGQVVPEERDILENNLRAAISAKGGRVDGRWGIDRLRAELEALDG